MIRIHFAAFRADREPIDLACALRLGGYPPMRGPQGPEAAKNDQLNDQAPAHFQSVDADQADIFFFPYCAHDFPEDARRVALEAQRRNLPCAFLAWGDADEPLDLPHGVLLRHSLFRDRLRPRERAMPAFCSDPLAELNRKFQPRAKQDIPSIGFCGYVSHPLARLVYRLSGRVEKARGLSLRAAALNALRRTPGIQSNFLTRNAYWAGAAKQSTSKFQARSQFLENLLGNDYTLCIRGAGNFSYRLYETLAAGRIPLFVNTLCVLPMEDQIDWKNHCVWVEESQLRQTGAILKQFHQRISPGQFIELQRRNRELWEQKLSPFGYYRELLQSLTSPKQG
ncbi:MAG: exostosin family protein [Tepidisphaeraceae bacterium]